MFNKIVRVTICYHCYGQLQESFDLSHTFDKESMIFHLVGVKAIQQHTLGHLSSLQLFKKFTVCVETFLIFLYQNFKEIFRIFYLAGILVGVKYCKGLGI